MTQSDESDRFTHWMTRFPEWSELGGASRGLLVSTGMFALNLSVGVLLAIGISLLRGDDDFGSETVGIVVLGFISVIGLLDAMATLVLNRPRRGHDGSGIRFAIVVALLPFWWLVPMLVIYASVLIHST